MADPNANERRRAHLRARGVLLLYGALPFVFFGIWGIFVVDHVLLGAGILVCGVFSAWLGAAKIRRT